MDRGAWWAIVHRVAQSQRPLTSRDQYSAYHNHSKINGKSKVVGDIKGQMDKTSNRLSSNSKHWKSVNVPVRNIRKNTKILITLLGNFRSSMEG